MVSYWNTGIWRPQRITGQIDQTEYRPIDAAAKADYPSDAIVAHQQLHALRTNKYITIEITFNQIITQIDVVDVAHVAEPIGRHRRQPIIVQLQVLQFGAATKCMRINRTDGIARQIGRVQGRHVPEYMRRQVLQLIAGQP